MGSLLFAGPFVVMWSCTWEVSIGGESVVAWGGPGSGICGVRWLHIRAFRYPEGVNCNSI